MTKTCLFQAIAMIQLSIHHPGTSDFQKLWPQKRSRSNKVAHYFFLIVYDMKSWKAINILIFQHIENFEFSLSRDDAYYQSDQNAPRGSALREWISEVREVKSEMEIWFTHFEKWKVKWKSGSLISRMKSEMKMPWYRDREWKVKWKCLKIEIESEKWIENASRLRSRSEISREILENQEIKKIFIHILLQMLFI